MKTWAYILLTFGYLLFASCNQGDIKTSSSNQKTKYKATYNNDTATAVIEHSESLFKGVLEINYRGLYKDSGDVKGIVKGDTLIGDFHYISYGLPKWRRIPIAFLRKENKLIMGEGLIKFTVGFPHFSHIVPIDFNEHTRLVFKKVD